MSKYKDSNKNNVTTLLHSLKESYSKRFREKCPQHLEPYLIEVAKKLKRGGEFQWTESSNGIKQIIMV